MTDLDKILFTSFTTIIGGVIVYSTGRIIEKFAIDPIHEYKKTLGNITDNLIFYANIYSNPSVSSKEDKDEASKALRRLASELNARISSIPFYRLFASLNIIPKYTNSIDASSSLIGLSNAMYHTDYDSINEKKNKIEKCLGIKT